VSGWSAAILTYVFWGDRKRQLLVTDVESVDGNVLRVTGE